MAGNLALQCSAMHGAGRRLWTEEIRRADLHAHCAERQRRRNTPRTCDAARCHDRNPDPLNNLGNQRECADLRTEIVYQGHAAMPACLETLRNDGIDPVCFEPERLVNGGR